ncbi:MAG: D-alanyl-D-alanine carboxypeptidase [Cellulophaga sp.]
MRIRILYIVVITSLIGCSSAKHKNEFKKIDSNYKSNFFNTHFVGVLIVDATTKDTIYKQNATKYFTPASNTKIATLYAALELLPEVIPSLKYIETKDTLYIEGTGDPSFLHPYLKDSTTLTFLKKQPKNIAVHLNNFQENKYGPGWAWEDYDVYYSPERSALPMYGNLVQISYKDSSIISPNYFEKKLIQKKHPRNRALFDNTFYFHTNRKDTLEIPFIVDSTITKELLSSVVEKEIFLTTKMPQEEKSILYGISSDTLYKRMMQQSDNFIAEQLLIVASSTLSDTLQSAIARKHLLKNQLANLRQPPRWVDGSGLSRYNLFSPESIVFLLQKIYTKIPQERLFNIFPAGGVSGTLKGRYKGNPSPYIYAKSGSLGNNYCLSGYLLSNSGKTLIFSFMHNHFKKPTAEIRREIEKVLVQLRDNY